MKKSKGISVLVVVVLLAVGAVGYSKFLSKSDIAQDEASKKQAGQVENSQNKDEQQRQSSSTWSVYENDAYAFKFNYPAQYNVKEQNYLGRSPEFSVEIVPNFKSSVSIELSFHGRGNDDVRDLCIGPELVSFGKQKLSWSKVTCGDAGMRTESYSIYIAEDTKLVVSVSESQIQNSQLLSNDVKQGILGSIEISGGSALKGNN